MNADLELPVTATAAESSESRRLPYVLLVFAAIALGMAVRDSGGNISTVALRWLSASLLAGIAAIAVIRKPPALRLGDTGVLWLLVPLLCVELAALIWDPFLLQMAGADFWRYRLCSMLLVAAAVICGVMLAGDDRTRRWLLPVLVGLHLAVGWVVVQQPTGIDVHVFQMEGSQALLRGQNPYAMTFRDPYPPASSAMFYGPGVSMNGILQFGYPYLPTTLLLAIPGYLAGDTRYATLVATAISALLIGYARPGRGSTIAAAALLVTPAFPLMAYAAWTDSFVLMLLALVWFCQCRARWALPYAAGLLLSSKQYMIVVAPLALLLIDRPWTLRSIARFGLRAFVTGCIVVLPLALWDPKAFWHSAVALQFHQPFRPDALSYLVWLKPSDPGKWLLLPFAFAGAMYAVLWPVRRRISFALGMAMVLFAFFATNKQAFANYYFLVIGALCVAAAAEDADASAITA
jgi:hypothetical protein